MWDGDWIGDGAHVNLLAPPDLLSCFEQISINVEVLTRRVVVCVFFHIIVVCLFSVPHLVRCLGQPVFTFASRFIRLYTYVSSYLITFEALFTRSLNWLLLFSTIIQHDVSVDHSLQVSLEQKRAWSSCRRLFWWSGMLSPSLLSSLRYRHPRRRIPSLIQASKNLV